MSSFEMIKYHKKEYPLNIPLNTEEIALNFDTKFISPKLEYSLHTEYSYTKRGYNNPFILKYDTVINANKNGIPLLWYSSQWAKEFALFIIECTKSFKAPKYIEIHPPYSDYMKDMNMFIEIYSVFEECILSAYPKTQILIENRCGSLYSGGKFIFSKAESFYSLAELIDKKDLNLRITFDVPQLYTAHNIKMKNSNLMFDFLEEFINLRNYINGLHLWGKRINENGRRIAHIGDLNSYFYNNIDLKNEFLKLLYNLFDDNKVRNMVLEVNSSNDDLNSIVKDLLNYSFNFV